MQQDVNHAHLVIYICFVDTSTSIWIKLLCNWRPYEQVTAKGFDSWQTIPGAHLCVQELCSGIKWQCEVTSLTA
jgi:hypothetical protein